MSYILEALKKADQTRHQSLDQIALRIAQTPPPKKKLRFYHHPLIVINSVLLVILLIIALYYIGMFQIIYTWFSDQISDHDSVIQLPLSPAVEKIQTEQNMLAKPLNNQVMNADSVALASAIPTKIDVHVYSEDPQKRFIILQGQVYLEGDILPQGWIVKEIQMNQVLLSHQQQTALIKVNP